MKRPKLSELTSQCAILERIGRSELHYCERNNVWAEFEIYSTKDDECTLFLYVYGYGYKVSDIVQRWQEKLPPGFVINVTEREEDNVFIYTIELNQS